MSRVNAPDRYAALWQVRHVIGRLVQDVLGLHWVEEGDGGESADTNRDGEVDISDPTNLLRV